MNDVLLDIVFAIPGRSERDVNCFLFLFALHFVGFFSAINHVTGGYNITLIFTIAV